jgi:hypothetical protein
MMALWMAIDKHSSKSAFLLSHFLNDGAATRNLRAFSEGEQYSRKDKELQNLIKAKTPKTSKVFILGATETLKTNASSCIYMRGRRKKLEIILQTCFALDLFLKITQSQTGVTVNNVAIITKRRSCLIINLLSSLVPVFGVT